jgi:acetolactate synthase-1/2/3 large subunit
MTRTVAAALVQQLAALGARHVFGYPGGQLTPIYDALIDEPRIRHFLARHEQAAGFMADGYARASGRAGVFLAVCGPGVYNAATALATSLTDSVPVLCISGQVPTKGAGLRSGYYHENEQEAAARSFCKAVVRAESPATAARMLCRAWEAATTGRPGPVLFEAPVDVLRAESHEGLVAWAPPPPPAPPVEEVERAVKLIRAWRRPLILAGGGVVASGAEGELEELASRLGAPIHHTANGKCAASGGHPLNVGLTWSEATSDLSGMGPFLSPLFEQADGLLAVGCRFTQLATGSWLLRPPPIVQIDIDAAEVGRHYPVEAAVISDARLALREVLARLDGPAAPPWHQRPSHRPWLLEGMDVVGAIQRVLPADAVVCADVTRLAYQAMARLRLTGRRGLLHPAGSVAMGYALPAALGARVAFPSRPVLALCGDGGFQMSGLELGTMVQEGLPVVTLVVNDACLSLIKASQDRHYSGRHLGVDLRGPDYSRFADSYGTRSWSCRDEESLSSCLADAFRKGEGGLVELRLS